MNPSYSPNIISIFFIISFIIHHEFSWKTRVRPCVMKIWMNHACACVCFIIIIIIIIVIIIVVVVVVVVVTCLDVSILYIVLLVYYFTVHI